MKQHIDKTQWDQLSEEQKTVLLKWIVSKGYHPETNDTWSGMSIGAMIEFLNEKHWFTGYGISIHRGLPPESSEPDDMDLRDYLEYEVEIDERVFTNTELCDALWEAIKEIL